MERVGGFFKNAGNLFKKAGSNIVNALIKLDPKINQVTTEYFKKPCFNALKWFESNLFTEASGNANLKDKKSQSPNVDGNGQLEHDGPDPYVGSDNPTNNSQTTPDVLDVDNWTVRPDASGHQQKKINADYILYRSQKTRDTIMIWTPTKAHTEKKSEGWKETVNKIK